MGWRVLERIAHRATGKKKIILVELACGADTLTGLVNLGVTNDQQCRTQSIIQFVLALPGLGCR